MEDRVKYIYVPSTKALIETIEDSAKRMVAKLVNPITDKEAGLAIDSVNILCAIRSLSKGFNELISLLETDKALGGKGDT